MTYDEIFSEVLDRANEAISLLKKAYTGIINKSDFTSSVFFSLSSSLSETEVNRYHITVENIVKEVTDLINRFRHYKSSSERSETEPDNFRTDEIKVIYETSITSCGKYAAILHKMRQSVADSPNATSAKKVAFNAMCDACVDLFKGVDQIISEYNMEHSNNPIDKIYK